MYLQETYITDEEALDIVLEYLWNEYEYETEEELYEAYEYLTDEEFEDILNEGLLRNFRNVGGALFDGGKALFNTARKSYRERSATSNFDDAVKKTKNRKPDNVGQHSVQQTPNIADRVVPSASSSQGKTSSVVPGVGGKKSLYNKSGGRKMKTSTVVPVGNFVAPQSAAGSVANVVNKQNLRKNRQEQPGPNTTPVSKNNKRQTRERIKELRSGKGRTVRPIPAGNTPKFQEKSEPVGKNKTVVDPVTKRRRRKKATYVEPKPPKQNPVPQYPSGKKRSGGEGFAKDIKKLSKEERAAKRNQRKAKKEAQKPPIVQTNQTPSNMSKNYKPLSKTAQEWKSTARSAKIAKSAKEGRPYYWSAKKR